MNTPEFLARQYGAATHLNARIALHSRFSTNKQGWTAWVFDHMILPAGAHILEAGCGTGLLWRTNRDRLPPGCEIWLTDASAGMVEEAQRNLAGVHPGLRFEVAPAQALPFPDDAFDVVIANHMLYHLPDLEAGLRELRRVLRPGGRFYAATIGENHLVEIAQLVRRFDPACLYRTDDYAGQFGLENGGAHLAGFFEGVTRHIYEDALAVTEPEPLIAYVGSMMPAEHEFSPEQMAAFARFVATEMSASGMFYVRKSQGMFEGRKPGS